MALGMTCHSIRSTATRHHGTGRLELSGKTHQQIFVAGAKWTVPLDEL